MQDFSELEEIYKSHSVMISQYDRDQRISAAVKMRANGYCECCQQKAPFIKENGEPYLEEHHLTTLREGRTDSIDNVCAVCPNCHRELHYGINSKEKRKELVLYLSHKKVDTY